MSHFPTTLIEWGATLLSLAGFWLCIRHRAVCFLVFLVADLGWFVSAWVNFHPSLLAQQAIYILLNVVGYLMWRKEEQLQKALEEVENRALQVPPILVSPGAEKDAARASLTVDWP